MAELLLPDYWTRRPAPPLTPVQQAQCDETLAAMLAHGHDTPFDYTLAIPKWQFLCHLTDQHHFVLHGSNDHHIEQLVPRQSSDINEFGAQKAVYAAGDGIWPMYFAIVDRSRVPTLVNACLRVLQPDGQENDAFYAFSISKKAAPHKPYIAGIIYVLPAETFSMMPAIDYTTYQVRVPQLVSHSAVKPLAKMIVTPEDFPFLTQMRTHVDERLAEYADAMNTGAPWPPEQ